MDTENVKSNLVEIQDTLKRFLKSYVPPLQIRRDDENVFEVAGTKETMQGRKKVNGFYFASIVPKPKDIRLYYFPIYTHVKKFAWISPELRKCLKGKSCFHIKKLEKSLEQELAEMIKVGVEMYARENLI